MVRLLIALRGAVATHQWSRAARTPFILAAVLGLLSAAGTFALGFAYRNDPGVAGDVLATVFALWLGGQLAQAALNGGDASLRPEVFALLPLPIRRLAWSLMVVGLVDPVLVLVVIAYAGVVPFGARGGVGPALVAICAALLLAALTSSLATLVSGVLGPGSRRGRDAGTMVTALVLAILAVAGTAAPSVVAALRDGHARWLPDLVRLLPSGWGVEAVADSVRGDGFGAALWLLGLAALTAAVGLIWPAVLRQRMTRGSAAGRRGSTGRPVRVQPRSATGAVVVKELRLWCRDPIRLTCLLIAVVVGAGVAIIPRVTTDTGLLMPFAGPLTVVIAAACACNLYGNDGTSLWLTIMTPGSSRPDVRGRSAAWAIVVAPLVLIETVVFTALSDRPDLWSWSLALVVALVGGSAAIIPLASLIAVQPLDEAGNPTPAWSLKVHVALLVAAASAGPAVAVLAAGTALDVTWVAWLALPVAAGSAVSLLWAGSALASARLARHQVDLLSLLKAAA